MARRSSIDKQDLDNLVIAMKLNGATLGAIQTALAERGVSLTVPSVQRWLDRNADRLDPAYYGGGEEDPLPSTGPSYRFAMDATKGIIENMLGIAADGEVEPADRARAAGEATKAAELLFDMSALELVDG